MERNDGRAMARRKKTHQRITGQALQREGRWGGIMQAINRQAKKVMDALTAGLEKIGDNKRIGNTEEIFPRIHTECVGFCNRKPVFSLTLHYKQKDGTIRTEDMKFIKGGDGGYYPTSFRQNAPIIRRQPVIVGVEGVIAYSEEQQATLACFANAWMKNIKGQQGLVI